MVEGQAASLDRVFHALADPTRRMMVGDLRAGRRSIGELAKPHAMSFAAASKHVKVLERAGLVRRSVQGRVHRCSLDTAPLGAAMDWLSATTAFWNERLDALETLLDTGRADDEP